MSNYTDNYFTDTKGQRWVKKEYAQTYVDQASNTEERLRNGRDYLMSVCPDQITVSEALSALGFGFDGLNKV